MESFVAEVRDEELKKEFLTILNDVVFGRGPASAPAPDCNPRTPRNPRPRTPPTDHQTPVTSYSGLHTMVSHADEYLYTSYTSNLQLICRRCMNGSVMLCASSADV